MVTRSQHATFTTFSVYLWNSNTCVFIINRAEGHQWSLTEAGVTMSCFAQPCQRDRLNGFRPLVNPFSNVLTFPWSPPSSVPLTMPGSSRDLHRALCFFTRCFPFIAFVFCYNWAIQIQTNKKHTSQANINLQLTFFIFISWIWNDPSWNTF